MQNLKGKIWMEILKEDQSKLLKSARAIDASTGNDIRTVGECTIDFEGSNFSIAGFMIEDGEIIIDGTAEFYNPID